MFLCNRTTVQEKQRPVLKKTQCQCDSALKFGQKYAKFATPGAGKDCVFAQYCFHLETRGHVLENWTVIEPYSLNGNCNARC